MKHKKSFWIKLMVWIFIFALIGLIIWGTSRSSFHDIPNVPPLPPSSVGD